MTDTLMIIGGNWEQKILVEKAKAMGLRIVLTDPSDQCAAKPLADAFYQVEPRDLSKMLKIATQEGIQGVIADACDYSHYASVVVARSLGLPNAGLEAAQHTTNKCWMRECVRDAAVMQPRFFACKALAEARKAMALIGLPVIVKPVDNRGAFGVSIVRFESELDNAFLDALINAHSRQVMVEAFVEGTHLTVDGICDEKGEHHNLAIASKTILSGDKPVITNVTYPAKISDEYKAHVLSVNQNVVKALGIRRGFTHSEYILDEKGRCFLVETANRGGGVFTASKILPHISHADLYGFLIAQALSRDAALKLAHVNDCIQLTFFVFENGFVKSIDGVDKVTALNGVLHFQLLIQEGQIINRPKNGAERHGFAIIAAQDYAALEQLKLTIDQTLEVRYADHA